MCTPYRGRCWKEADEATECRTPSVDGGGDVCTTYGHCSVNEGLCQALTTEDCQQTTSCRNSHPEDGECFFEP